MGTAARLRPLLRFGRAILAVTRGLFPRGQPAGKEAVSGDRCTSKENYEDVEHLLAVSEGTIDWRREEEEGSGNVSFVMEQS